MDADAINKIRNQICMLIDKGDASLLLGAGFTLGNETIGTVPIPNGDDLRSILLSKCGKPTGPRTTLKDAYTLASRLIPDFHAFLEQCFTVKVAKPWQEKIFEYAWNRIYTTNIDNVLDVAFEQARAKGTLGADFSFFNYVEPNLANNAIGTVPVVTIHGTIKRPSDGYIFSTLEYGHAASRRLDWHNELAAKIMLGGLVVIGNQLDEADIDSHLASRQRLYGSGGGTGNWIVMPNPDEIKRDNYIAAGFDVIDATAEEFLKAIYSILAPRSIQDIILESLPTAKTAKVRVRAMTWFKEAFRPVLHELERALGEKGILRHFVTGVHPDWFYIVHAAHARTSPIDDLVRVLGDEMRSHDKGVGIVHILGPSGSGKTTALRTALQDLVKTYQYVYEYDSANGIDVDLLSDIVAGFTAKTAMVFYSAAEYYYAVNAVANRLKNKDLPFCLFILEDRIADNRKSKHQLADCVALSKTFAMKPLSRTDAMAIARRIDEHGLSFQNFSEYHLDKRAGIIIDKERGFSGDLLSALFSLTHHENFEQKIYEDYESAGDGLPRQVLDVTAIMSSLGFSTPLQYAAGFLQRSVDDVADCLEKDLDGIVLAAPGTMRLTCRHRIIADYYFRNLIAGQGSAELLMGTLAFLSKQFTIDQIKYHPLAYQMYKSIISFDFLFDKYFSRASRRADTERTYHEAQKIFGKDGIFWLHYGRFYRKIGELDAAIDCFRTGLTHYNSFQTRHSLGTALVDKYIESSCSDNSAYEEGVTLLNNERLYRGTLDAYPTCTLCDLLIKVLSGKPEHRDARERLKDCINFGLKHFKEDEFFDQTVKNYFALKS